MRVLHLPIVICNQPWEMSRGLRKIGVPSDYMIHDDNDSAWLLPGQPEYNLRLYHRKGKHPEGKINFDKKLFFWWALFRYDVFHYHSDFSLFDDYSDLKILKKFGKKIVVSYWGCDIRQKSVGLKQAYSACKDCTIGCDDEEKQENHEQFAKYADLMLVHTPELGVYCPEAKIFPQSIDTDYWQAKPKIRRRNSVFRIFHPVGNAAVRGNAKGTREIQKAVDRLKKEGFKVELVFCDKIPNRELKPYYEQANVVIEGLKDGSYGITSIEAMAMSRPVMCYIWPSIYKATPGLPIINVDPQNIYKKLKWAITHQEELKEIGKESRDYTVRIHDSKIVARDMVALYEEIDAHKDLAKTVPNPTANPKICLLVSNDLTHDPRVRKQAVLASSLHKYSLVLGWTVASDDYKNPMIKRVDGNRVLCGIFKQPLILNLKTYLYKFFSPSYSFLYNLKQKSFLKDKKIKRVLWELVTGEKFVSDLEKKEIAERQSKAQKSYSNQTSINPPAKVKTKVNPIKDFYRELAKIYYYYSYYKQMTDFFVSQAKRINPDIVHANDLDTLLAGYLIKKKTGAKLVFDAHEIWTEMGSGFPKFVNFVFKLLENFLLRRVDAFVSVNQSIIEYTAKRYKIDFAKRGIITSAVYNAPNLEIVKKQFRSKRIKVLYQGRFEFNRGLEEFIQATDQVPTAEFYIRGYGVNEPELRALARQKTTKNLRFLPPVEMTDMVKAATFAQVGVLPYLPKSTNNYLCTPNKLFEYIMAGLALVVSDLPELKLITKKYDNGLVFKPGDAKSLARAINSLVKTQEKLVKYQKNSLIAAKELNWGKESEKLRQIYTEILQK